MTYSPICLITEWQPMVGAYRAAGSMDFYWDADDPVDLEAPTLPYTIERSFFLGWAFQAAAWFYESLRPHLPHGVLQPSDAFLTMLYPEAVDGQPVNDLATDAGIASGTGDNLWYAMRPSTVTRAVGLSDAVPWAQIETIGESADHLTIDEDYMPDVGWFLTVLSHHQQWLREAAETGRGVVVLVSF
jgi:hypothetical protein